MVAVGGHNFTDWIMKGGLETVWEVPHNVFNKSVNQPVRWLFFLLVKQSVFWLFGQSVSQSVNQSHSHCLPVSPRRRATDTRATKVSDSIVMSVRTVARWLTGKVS